MNSEKRLKHMLQKYPELMVPLPTNQTTNLTKKHSLNRIHHRSLERTSRYRTRRPSRRALQLVISEALSCTICSKLLHSPVTLECGDTFCKECLLEKVSTDMQCPKCGKPTAENPRCNVLMQEMVNAVTENEKEYRVTCNRVQHTYKLRSRNYNLNHEKKRPLATVKRKHPSSEIRANIQLAETIGGCDNEGTITTSLTCTLCGRVLFDPITTSCGHTFCRGCVARVLDYGLACPLCMAPLPPGAAADRGVTRALEHLVQGLLPQEYHARRAEGVKEIEMVDEEDQMPVFVCTSAFPGVACPLYVYEPRYRLLTRRCLQSSRKRFAMAAPAISSSSAASTSPPGAETDLEHPAERFAAYGTVLEVRDAVYMEDGTSILTTVGLKRFRVAARGEKDGYDTATITYLTDTPPPPSQLPTLTALHNRVYTKAISWIRSLPLAVQAEVTQSLGAFPVLEAAWGALPDGPAWAWWLVPVLPLSARLQLAFLSTTSLEKRLRAIDKLLDRVEVRMKGMEECRVVEKEEGCGRVEERYQTQTVQL